MKKIIILALLIILSTIVVTATTSYYYIDVNNNTDYADRSIRSINQDPDPAEPGGTVEIKYKVQNFGLSVARDVEFELVPEYPFTLLPGQDGIAKIGSISPEDKGEKGTIISYKLLVDKNAPDGDHKLKLRFKTATSGGWTEIEDYSVKVRTKSPIITIKSIETTPARIKPGEISKTKLQIENTESSLMKNVVLTLDLSNTKFSPITTTNQIKIGDLKAEETKEAELNLISDPTTTPGIYKIPTTITYDDLAGNSYTKSYTISLIIDEEAKLLVNLEETDLHTPGANGKITISASNIGNSNIKFLSIKIEKSDNYDILSPDTIYVGNMESDDFETAQYKLKLNNNIKEQNVPVKIQLNYQDSFNKEYTLEKEISLEIYSAEKAQTLGLTTKTSTASIAIMFIIIILTTAFVLFMLADLIKTPMARYKKIIWFVIIIGTHFVGSIIYYLIGRKKHLGKE